MVSDETMYFRGDHSGRVEAGSNAIKNAIIYRIMLSYFTCLVFVF
ncbi:hypothetical protein [Pseudomonas phage Sirocco]